MESTDYQNAYCPLTFFKQLILSSLGNINDIESFKSWVPKDVYILRHEMFALLFTKVVATFPGGLATVGNSRYLGPPSPRFHRHLSGYDLCFAGASTVCNTQAKHSTLTWI